MRGLKFTTHPLNFVSFANFTQPILAQIYTPPPSILLT